MSIEGGGTATSPKTVTGAENQGSKARGKPGGGADAPAASGFLALLNALESQPGVGDDGTAATDQLEDGSRPAATQMPPTGALLPLSDPSPIVAQNLPADLAMLLAQAGEGGGDKLDAVGEGPRHGGRAALRLVVDQRGGPLATSAALETEKPAHLKHNGNAWLDQTAQSSTVRAPKVAPGGAGFQSGAGASLKESHLVHLSAQVDVAAREPAMSGILVSSGMGESLLRQSDRPMPKLSVLQGPPGGEGIWGQPGSLSGNGAEAPAAPADPSMLSFESQLAETVSYWATQGVQNAELKLDGPGGERVEVRISLKGEDAHIDFRTDQPEIRRILEGAATHLKDILAGEGLVLSGVSVGTSGQEGADAREQRNRQSALQATLITSGVAPAEARLRVAPSIAGTVDIFV